MAAHDIIGQEGNEEDKQRKGEWSTARVITCCYLAPQARQSEAEATQPAGHTVAAVFCCSETCLAAGAE